MSSLVIRCEKHPLYDGNPGKRTHPNCETCDEVAARFGRSDLFSNTKESDLLSQLVWKPLNMVLDHRMPNGTTMAVEIRDLQLIKGYVERLEVNLGLKPARETSS